MIIKSEFPFHNYTCYKNLHKGMQRYQVCIVHKVTGKRRTILYSKFLMSIKEGIILGPKDQVDHIDQDKLNDDINNLEIVTEKENKDRYNKANPGKTTELKCNGCGRYFIRRSNHVNKEYKDYYCSKSCLSFKLKYK